MTKDEALKLALEALDCIYSPLHVREIEKVGNAMKAIKEALAQSDQESDDLTIAYMSGFHDGKNKDAPQRKQEQEPVAIKRMKEWIEYLKRKSDFGQHMKIPSEINAGTCWELALELEQFINTTPPQRTWVGLTKEERDHFEGLHLYAARGKVDVWIEGVPAFIQAIEAKLREKNGG